MANQLLPHEPICDAYDQAAPAALVIAERDANARDAADALALAGCRDHGRLRFAEAAETLDRFGRLDLILVDAAGVPDALLDTVLARADAIAEERMIGVVAIVDPEQIDAAAAHLLGPRALLLCNPTAAERASAIAWIKWRARGRLNDVTRDAESVRLQRLNEEVARIADALARLTRGEDAARFEGIRAPGSDYRGPEEGGGEASAAEIRAVIRARRLRAQFFAAELFADPAWDMLLDLFAADLERRRVSVSSLCIAAAVPPTTALRWISTLHDAGLFERQADPADRRRAYIALSEKGQQGMRSYASAVKRAGLSLV